MIQIIILFYLIHSQDKNSYWFLNKVRFSVHELFFTILIKWAHLFPRRSESLFSLLQFALLIHETNMSKCQNR